MYKEGVCFVVLFFIFVKEENENLGMRRREHIVEHREGVCCLLFCFCCLSVLVYFVYLDLFFCLCVDLFQLIVF